MRLALHSVSSAGVWARELAPLTAHTTSADYVRRPRLRCGPGLVNYTPHGFALSCS